MVANLVRVDAPETRDRHLVPTDAEHDTHLPVAKAAMVLSFSRSCGPLGSCFLNSTCGPCSEAISAAMLAWALPADRSSRQRAPSRRSTRTRHQSSDSRATGTAAQAATTRMGAVLQKPGM